MNLNLQGKRALLLASSRGLGFACAMGLAREGCDVVICSRDRERINSAAKQIRKETNARVHAAVCDVSSPEAVQELVDQAVETFGGLEIVVHNAGGPPPGTVTSLSPEKWYDAFDLNLMSFVWLVRAVVPVMRKSNYGRILAITSSSIKEPIPNLVLSNTMRTGVLGLAKTLSKELGADNILVNVIAPGRIATERVEELDRAAAARRGVSVEQVHEESRNSIPLGRLGRPEELANLAVFLASEAGSYITGTAIAVDGGRLNALQ